MRTLVTGGAGFIGSAVCRQLVAAEDDILNLDALTYASARSSVADLEGAAGYAFVQADITDERAVADAFAAFRPDAVIHLAAETHVDRSITGPSRFIQSNVTGTFVMLQAALRHWETLGAAERDRFRFVHVSTDEVFGSLGAEGAFTEETPYDPRSPYSASKAAADHLASAWRHTYGLPVVISNCSNNYGPRQFPEKLIPLAILNGLQGRTISVYGDGLNVRDWLFVDDHADALLRIRDAGVPGASYNVGARNERTNIALLETLCDLLDELAGPLPDRRSRRELLTFVQDRPGHDRRYAIDPSRIEEQLGWRARTNFDEGLRRTVRWYLDNEAWWRPLRERYEGGRLGVIGA